MTEADRQLLIHQLLDENRRLKEAGGLLAIAALRVIHEYDGLHRLGLAAAGWSIVVSGEGGRDRRYGGRLD